MSEVELKSYEISKNKFGKKIPPPFMYLKLNTNKKRYACH